MEQSKLLNKYNSSSEDVDCVSESHTSKSVFDLEPNLLKLLSDIPGAMDYINKLQKLIKKYIGRIKRLKDKLRKNEFRDAYVQTDNEVHVDQTSVDTNELESEPKSLADDIKQAAESAMQNMGFVYEETSGLYYDYNTGYYYNAEYGLYYDSKSGTYMKYNADTQLYEFHSQVNVTQPGVEGKKAPRKRKTKYATKDAKRLCEVNLKKLAENDVEEGECSESNDEVSTNEEASDSDTSESSKQWPPCMRIILESSENPNLKVGSLYIITCDGGTLGREGNHSITLTDPSTSKHHLKFMFDKEADCYQVIDLGSRNGTLLNGKRMSSSKQESDPMQITHGSKLQIGSTILLCHIHTGTQTCGYCEPGLYSNKDIEVDKVVKPCKTKTYKSELKNLKKMYGVNYVPNLKLADGYVDRAQRRRKTVGSQNPHEKTQTSSVDESIAKENKGFKMLSKMGWKEGESLGKDGSGLLEPIKVQGNTGLAGVGCEELISKIVPTEKQNVWKKAQERFDKLPDTKDAFQEES